MKETEKLERRRKRKGIKKSVPSFFFIFFPGEEGVTIQVISDYKWLQGKEVGDRLGILISEAFQFLFYQDVHIMGKFHEALTCVTLANLRRSKTSCEISTQRGGETRATSDI